MGIFGLLKGMKPKTARILKLTAQILIGLPLLSALAGLILGPTVLHPFRHAAHDQIAEADHVFSSVNATRQDFVVHNPDGTILQGWKVRPAHPNGDWVLLLHGRSHNRYEMLPYAEFLLSAEYSVAMMDARAHGSSGGSMSTYGYLERFDARAIVDALESSERVSHLFALGESMGAAVSLQFAAFDPRIDAVVAEGSFRDLRRGHLRLRRTPAERFSWKVALSSRRSRCRMGRAKAGQFPFRGYLSGKGSRRPFFSCTARLWRERSQDPVPSLGSNISFGPRSKGSLARPTHWSRAGHQNFTRRVSAPRPSISSY
jgi:pimeloyl-ACP methyl ester carboxylesterase